MYACKLPVMCIHGCKFGVFIGKALNKRCKFYEGFSMKVLELL